MGIFSFKFRDGIPPLGDDTRENEYRIMCHEFDDLASRYIVDHELFSDAFWEFLIGELKVTKADVVARTDFSLDEHNRPHKGYYYTVKIRAGAALDETNLGDRVYVSFLDEYRNLEDRDYHSYVGTDDKRDKVSSLVVYYTFSSRDWVEEKFVPRITSMIHIPSEKNQFFVIQRTMDGYHLKPSYVRESDYDLAVNYGDAFPEKSDRIVTALRENTSGLYLFHGPAGTGKTSYIRRIISELSTEKTIIYVPSYMMEVMADPEIISFVGGFKDAIMVVEDAEGILSSGDGDRSPAVSNMLNMSDGLLNDHMDIQIIATFNAERKQIDKALLRAGRLRVSHKFNPLTPTEATRLSAAIGQNRTYDSPTTLADVYEGERQIFDDLTKAERSVGFRPGRS